VQLNHHRSGSGDPLLLIHGIGSRWQMWEPVIGALAAHHEVIAIDLPGFGDSPMPPPGTRPGADSLTSLVSGFLAEIGVERPHVAGNSLGGLIALNLAVRGQVRTATAVSPAGFATRPEMAGGKASLWVSVRAARLLAAQADRMLTPALGRKLALSLFVAHPSGCPRPMRRRAPAHWRPLPGSMRPCRRCTRWSSPAARASRCR
jgi:pimeloyl-ACP methyl ester carboxylesterase